MTAILFVCHGNICRSTMAQYVMQHLVDEAGLSSQFVIDSAATSTEEIGNPVHRGTRKALAAHGIACGDHRARQVTRRDARDFDLIIGMDGRNMRSLRSMLGPDAYDRIRLLLEYAGSLDDIADPWYTGDFETTFDDVMRGCTGLLAKLTGGK